MPDTPIHPATLQLIRACALGAIFTSLTACVTVGKSPSASAPAPLAPSGSAGSLAAPAQAPAGMAQPVAAARLTRDALANTYQTMNETGFGFTLVLRKNGTSTMEMVSDDPESNKVLKYHGKWVLNADRITVEQKVGKRTDRLVYVVRAALKDLSTFPNCRGAFGLEAVKLSNGGRLQDHFVWPEQAILAEQAPCPKGPAAQRAQPASKR